MRARRARARERLLSCREPASRDPQVAREETFGSPHARAPFRLLPTRAPRQAVLRASSWLAPSFSHQQALRPPGEEDARCVRPTSATHSNCVHPHLVCSRFLTPLSRRGRPAENKAPSDFPGDRTFHDVRDRFGGSSFNAGSRVRLESRAWAFSSHGADATEPLTPLSRSPGSPSASPAFAGAASWP